MTSDELRGAKRAKIFDAILFEGPASDAEIAATLESLVVATGAVFMAAVGLPDDPAACNELGNAILDAMGSWRETRIRSN